MKVFVDTNVLLDVLARREPFYSDAARIWSLAERGRIEALVLVISFNNVYYVVRKASNRKSADRSLHLMRGVFTPVPLSVQILNQAIDAKSDDFEDAIQFHSAIHAEADCLITRDADHFPTTDLPILSPAAFLASLSSQSS
jgi:predicted nucleic acid-binding protein